MARPNSNPPFFVVKNASNTFGRCSAEMPCPASVTAISTEPSKRCVRKSTLRSSASTCSIASMAFNVTLSSTCRRAYAIGLHLRQRRLELRAQHDMTAPGVAADEPQRLSDEIVDVQRLQHQRPFARERSEATDDVGGEPAFVDDVGKNLAQ